MKAKSQKIQTPNLSFMNAARVMADRGGSIRFALVGCGGTGSHLAPAIGSLASVLVASGREVNVAFIDHDRVEEKNIPRQNFCDVEKGLHKSVALAARFNAAWKNLHITALTEKFDEDMLDENWGGEMRSRNVSGLTIMIGCVDKAAGRRAMAAALNQNYEFGNHYLWWLDTGNDRESGQVLLGSAARSTQLTKAFKSKKVCVALPSPALQAPELLRDKPVESPKADLSCAELMILNEQSLTVNRQVAAIASDYLMRLTMGMPLRRFATYFDQESGTSQSKYVTPEEVARVIKKPAQYVMQVKTITTQQFLTGDHEI